MDRRSHSQLARPQRHGAKRVSEVLPAGVRAKVWRWLQKLWSIDRLRGLATFFKGQRVVIAVPGLWLAGFFLLPFLIVLKISFAEAQLSQPPYSALLDWAENGVLTIRLSLANFALLVQDDLYLSAYLNSLRIAAIATGFTLLLGFPMAYAMSRAPARWRLIMLMGIILPFWTSFLIRVYAWIGLLKPTGLLSTWLLQWGLIDTPLHLLHTNTAVYIGIVYTYLPFMILPLYANLLRLDPVLLEAAADLGCRPFKAFFLVTLPQAVPGIVAGSLLVFIPAVGEFVIPDLLGWPDSLMIGKLLWSEFFTNRDWPVAAAVAVALLLLLVVPILLFQGLQARQDAAPH